MKCQLWAQRTDIEHPPHPLIFGSELTPTRLRHADEIDENGKKSLEEGSASQKYRELFGLEKADVKLQSICVLKAYLLKKYKRNCGIRVRDF